MLATQTFDKAGARYSEAALVKKLEELGIGRPSTYAPTISTIQTRGYVEKEWLGRQRAGNSKSLELKAGKITENVTTEVTRSRQEQIAANRYSWSHYWLPS